MTTDVIPTVDDIALLIQAYIDNAKTKTIDGLTWVEFGELLVGLLRLAVRLVDSLSVSGDQRKAIVLAAAAALFDSIADRCVPLPMLPLWLLCRGPIRALVLALASGAVEALLPLVRSLAT